MIDPIKAALSITDTQYSLLQGLAVAIFAAVLGIPAARWADLHGRRNVILVGAVGWSLATLACAFVASFPQLFMARVAMGIGEVFLFPAALSLIADIAPPQRMSSALALFACGGPAGGAIALFSGGWILTNHDAVAAALPIAAHVEAWRIAFLICGSTGVLTAALMLSVPEPKRTSPVESAYTLRQVASFIGLHRNVFAAVSGGMLLIALCVFATSAWTPTVLIRSHGIRVDKAGQLTGVAALLGGTGLAWLAGRATDWFHDRGRTNGVILVSMALTLALTGLASVAAFAGTDEAATLAWLAVYALLGVPTVLAGTALQLISPVRMRAQIMAAHLLLLNALSLTAGPFAVAFLTDKVFQTPLAAERSLGIVDIVACSAALALFAGIRRRFAQLRTDLA